MKSIRRWQRFIFDVILHKSYCRIRLLIYLPTMFPGCISRNYHFTRLFCNYIPFLLLLSSSVYITSYKLLFAISFSIQFTQRKFAWTCVHFVIHGHGHCFENVLNCTSRYECKSQTPQNLMGDHKLHIHEQFMRFSVHKIFR